MAARKHYVALDGLRGVAALAVLFYHVELAFNGSAMIFRHGYLGVDFFFVLSGFVIGAAYEGKFPGAQGGRSEGTLTAGRFGLVRAVRLYPLMILGAFLGALSTIVLGHDYGFAPKVMLQQLLFIPAIRSGGMVFPYNNTQWSLLFEVVANVAHYFILRRLSAGWLAIIAALAGVVLSLLAFEHGSVDMGNGISSLGGGLMRVTFSYCAGLIIWRLHKAGVIHGLKQGWWLAALGLVALTAVQTPAGSVLGIVVDLLSVGIGFPVLVAIALKPIGHPVANRAAEWLAALSYPVYILQSPFLDVLHAYTPQVGTGFRLLSAMLFIAGVLALSYAALRLLDEPVRRYLGKRLHLVRKTPAYTAP